MRTDLGQERQQTIEALENLLREIKEAQDNLKQAQTRLEGMIPLSVAWKYKTCGKKHCRCTRGMLHGPYPYLYEYRDGKRIERYLGVGWDPPEGMVAREQFRTLMRELRIRRRRLEQLQERLEKAMAVMGGWAS